MAVLTRREVDDGVRATLRFPSEVDFFPFFQSWFEQFKKGFNLHREHLEILESQIDWWIVRFRSGRGSVNPFRVTLGSPPLNYADCIFGLNEQNGFQNWIIRIWRAMGFRNLRILQNTPAFEYRIDQTKNRSSKKGHVRSKNPFRNFPLFNFKMVLRNFY